MREPLMFDPAVCRMLDANFNRAREALRVMEDFARFVLDDASLSAAMKDARHELAAIFPRDLTSAITICRDTVGDVGTTVAGSGEYLRTNSADVAVAAGKRLTEALRVIEEYAKTIEPEFARRVEALRYRTYDLDRRLAVTHRARARFGTARLYVILTEAYCAGDWWTVAQNLVRAGVDVLQLREKNLADAELLARARRLAALCRDHGTIFIVNDRPDIAVLSQADGVHLGQDDLAVADARRVLHPHMVLGRSTHTPEQVDRAILEAPDYIAVGPMFATATKPQDHIAGPPLLVHAVGRTGLPVVAIGGIDPSNAGAVLSAGACCLCVCGAVLGAPDPAAVLATLRGRIAEMAPSPTSA